MTTPTLNLETVYIITSHFYEDTVLLNESEIPTIGRHLNALRLDEGWLVRDGDRIIDCQADEFARIATPEELAHEVNLMLESTYYAGNTRTRLCDHLYAAPGTHDSTLIVGNGTAHIEGNAVEIINVLWALDPFDGIEAVWAALAKFPFTCDTKPEHTEPEHTKPEHCPSPTRPSLAKPSSSTGKTCVTNSTESKP